MEDDLNFFEKARQSYCLEKRSWVLSRFWALYFSTRSLLVETESNILGSFGVKHFLKKLVMSDKQGWAGIQRIEKAFGDLNWRTNKKGGFWKKMKSFRNESGLIFYLK